MNYLKFPKFSFEFEIGSEDNVSALIFIQSMLVGIIFIPFQYAAGGAPFLLFSFSIILSGLLCLSLMRFFKISLLSKLTFIITTNLLILINAKTVGIEGGVQYFFAPAVSLPFVMFNFKSDKKSLFFSILLPLIFSVVLSLVKIDLIPRVYVPSQIIHPYALMAGLLSLGMVAFSIFYFRLALEHSEQQIITKNKVILESEKMASLGILASGIAHEINNPLAIVVGNATLRKKKIEADEKIDQKDFASKIEKIISSTNRISKIISSLKKYSRNSKNDKITLINLDKVIEEVIVLMQKNLEVEEVKIEFNLKNIKVWAHEDELIQVFINLISNSIDATKSLPVKWIKFESEVFVDHSIVRIIDSGSEISPEIINNLFTPFYTTKPTGQGTGLGLYVCKNIIESYGGSLLFETNLGHNCFVLKFNAYFDKKY